MAARTPARGIKGWIVHRLINNYWSFPVAAIAAAPVVALGIIFLDRNGATGWLLDNDLALVRTADTAKDLAGVAVGLDTALLVLYCSISLLVLTLAASNLGVRLIDRWLEKPLVRITLSGLSFSVIYALVQMAAIDAEAPLGDTPLLGITVLLALQVMDLCLLAVALHELGRTMFVDHSIAHVGRDAGRDPMPLVPGPAKSSSWRAAQTVTAPREGYVEGLDLGALAGIVSGDCGRIRILAAPGTHVLKGEALIAFEHTGAPLDDAADTVAIGEWRSDAQGIVFDIRLLVEVAARALSPAVNDFYTALACTDRLTLAMAGQAPTWIDADRIPLWSEDDRFELIGQDFAALFAHPLAAFRQAACDYPSVSLRMIDNYARLIGRTQTPGLRDFYRDQACALANHAMFCADFAGDKADLQAALDRLDDAADPLPRAA